jgi:DNA-binding beta-propeller fold protein YncE
VELALGTRFAVARHHGDFQASGARSVEDVSAIFVRADPNGLAFDRTTDRLYVADAKTGSVLVIDGAHEMSVARIPSGGVIAANRLGGVAVAPDGTIYVARLGYGTAERSFRSSPMATSLRSEICRGVTGGWASRTTRPGTRCTRRST